MRHIDIGNEPLAMVEFAITADEQPRALACSAAGTEAAARCTEYNADGDVTRRFADLLVDVYGLDAVSVQRASEPVTAPH